MDFPSSTIENTSGQASATQAKETGLAQPEYDKKRKKRFWEGVTILLMMVTLSSCVTTKTTTGGEKADTLQVETKQQDSIKIEGSVKEWTLITRDTNTVMTVTINEQGDVVRADKVTTIKHNREVKRDSIRIQNKYQNIWHRIKETHWKTVTVTKEKQDSLLARTEKAGFWCLLVLVLIIITMCLVKSKIGSIIKLI